VRLYEPGEIVVARSELPGLAWPAIPDAERQGVLSVLAQLQYSQFYGPERLRALQYLQLGNVVRYAQRASPWYRKSLAGVEPRGLDDATWSTLPLLTRRVLQERASHVATPPPKAHGKVRRITTSGSTGAPVSMNQTGLTELFWNAFALRELLWRRADLTERLAIVRLSLDPAAAWPEGARTPGWLRLGDAIAPQAESRVLDIRTPVRKQLEWLRRVEPAWLLTYPSNLHHLALEARRQGLGLPTLRGAITLSEVLRPETRALVHEVFGVAIGDSYTTQEAGYLAIQCPEHERYHVQSEGVLLEVLDGDGKPVPPGGVGRVVISTLHNLATPLIRYEVGDWAEVGPPCPCGRGLPVLTRILGRERNLLITPDGDRVYPFFGTAALVERLPVLQHQLVQTARDALEMRLVTGRPLEEAEVAWVVAHLRERLGADYRVEVTFHDALERGASGKFEDFVCLVED